MKHPLKHALTPALISAVAGLFVIGCGSGGGGGGGGTTKSVAGIWTGTTTSSQDGTVSNIAVQYTQTGTTVSGTSLINTGGHIIAGPTSGTITGSTANININYGTTLGTAAIT